MAGVEEDIIICRCEDVTLGDVRRAIREGAATMDEVRRVTRAGMGPCQGRTCCLLIASEVARSLGKPAGEVLPSTFRPPMKAVKMGELALVSAGETGGERGGLGGQHGGGPGSSGGDNPSGEEDPHA